MTDLKTELLAFEEFINEPPVYEDQRTVRDYRHELYRIWSPMREKIIAELDGRHAQRAPNHGNALTDVGPDFRVVSVRVLQSAYDRIDAMLASIEPDLRAANSVRIELRHLINERHTGAAVTSADGGGK